jgi:hypothetical protein
MQYFTAAETELAQKMGELWAKFIFDELTEDEWPHYKADTEDYLSIGDNGPSFIPKRGYRVTECEFWDTAYPEVLGVARSVALNALTYCVFIGA